MSYKRTTGPFQPLKRTARAARYYFENRIRITLTDEELETLEAARSRDAGMDSLALVIRRLAMRTLTSQMTPALPEDRPRVGRTHRVNINLAGQQLDVLERWMSDNELCSHAAALRAAAIAGAVAGVNCSNIPDTGSTFNPGRLLLS